MINPDLLNRLAEADIHGTYMESRLFQSTASISRLSTRELADLAYVSVMALFVVYYESSTRKAANNYANDVYTYIAVNNDFSAKRIMAKDLYLVFHGLSDRNDTMVSSKLRTTAINDLMWSKIHVNVPILKRFFADIAQSSLDTKGFMHRFLFRLEIDLYITDSTLRELRRNVQEWYRKSPSEKTYVIARLLTWMQTHANAMDMIPMMQKLASVKDIDIGA